MIGNGRSRRPDPFGNGRGLELSKARYEAAKRRLRSQQRSNELQIVKRGWFDGPYNLDTYLQKLVTNRAPAQIRARDPYGNHAWVYACAEAIATAATTAPLRMYRDEGADAGDRVPQAGYRRAAIQRLHARSIGRRSEGQTPIDDHPLLTLLNKPNPLQDGLQFLAFTFLWMAIRGECFWVLDYENMGSGPPPIDRVPARIWPAGPDCFEPIFDGATRGELLGWRFRLPPWVPEARDHVELILDRDEVVQFKRANPHDPVRGQSKISAVVETVVSDIKIRQREVRLLDNNAIPDGVLEYDGVDVSVEDLRKRWEQRHRGVENAGRVAVLSGGLHYNPVGLSPVDMDHLNSRRWNREEVCAVMDTPPSVLGLTESVNYATGMMQWKVFWMKGVLPPIQFVEKGIETSSLMRGSTDRVYLCFDLTDVEPLRVGVQEKVDLVNALCNQTIHMDPRTAFDVVRLDVPRYKGDDVNLALGRAQAEEDAIRNPEPQAPPGRPQTVASPNGKSKPERPGQAVPTRRAAAPKLVTRRGRRIDWDEFLTVQSQLEGRFRAAYRRWADRAREDALSRFDVMARAERRATTQMITRAVQLAPLISNASAWRNWLKQEVRPAYARAVLEGYAMMGREIGAPAIEPDDPRLIEQVSLREGRLVDSVSRTTVDAITRAMEEGLKVGEGPRELRLRMTNLFDLASSSAKAVTVARTETAGMINGARDVMMRAQGIKRHEWVTAGDVDVRDTHQVFGEAGPVDVGYNFLDLVGGGGTLEYPGDHRAPADETINCRCFARPA